MSDPSVTPDRDRVMRIIQARCPEIGPADLALIGTIHPGVSSAEPDLPIEIGEQIMDAIAALEGKLDQLAQAVGDDGADDLTG